MFRYRNVPVESDSNDEYLEQMFHRTRRIKHFRQRRNHMEDWNDEEFLHRFRLTKQTVLELHDEIADEIRFTTERNNCLKTMEQLLLTLRFYACGNMLITVGDFQGVHKSTAGRTIKTVSQVIAQLHQQYIRFSQTEEDIRKSQNDFYNISAFPRVIGAIDCTHVKIQSIGGENAENFRNRKGYFSLNVQAICDADLKILDIVARWPGSTHDQTIFNNSRIKTRFEKNEFGNGFLLGDSGYAATRYLKTPLHNPTLAHERLYQEAHIRTRNVIESLFGVMKRRFPILALGLRFKISTIQAVITGCAVLHNIARNNKEEEAPLDLEVMERVEDVIAEGEINEENQINNNFENEDILEYFRNL